MSCWQYLLLVNVYLVLFYGFYAVLLRSETFFNLNRLYLVASALLSFLIPVIHADWVKDLFITRQMQHTLHRYSQPLMVYHFKLIEDHQVTIAQALIIIYAAGAIFFIVKFIWQLASLRKIIDQPEGSAAFSFFRSIRISTSLDNNPIITAHEQVHVRQWHSADVLLMEAVTIINWFNPVAYFYRFGIKHIHEFIADRQALAGGTSKSEYALLLLSQAVKAPAHNLVNTFFNHSLLRERIIMLQKGRSRRTALLKYGLSAPLFILMLILSSATINKISTVRFFNKVAEKVLSSPVPAIEPAISNNEIKIKRQLKPEPVAIPEAKVEEPAAAVKIVVAEEPIFITVEKEPEFKGGISDFYLFLRNNLKYPDPMLRNNIQGKVFITLTVEKDGSLSDMKSIKDIGYGSAEEAMRVLKLSPKWEPGYQNGHRVRVRYTIPFSFTIAGEMTSSGDVPVKEEIADNGKTEAPSFVTPASSDTARRHGTTLIGLDTQLKPLYILDGKEVTGLDGVDPSDIASISVIRKAPEIDLYVSVYGSKAQNGVVDIKTRNPKRSPR